MAQQGWILRFARWHIWLGWLVAVPLLIWTISGVVMVARPIEEVRGEHLRIEQRPEPLPGFPVPIFTALDQPRTSPVRLETTMQRGTMVTRATFADGHVERYTGSGNRLPPLSAVEAQAVVREGIVGGDAVESVTFFAADETPLDFRRPEDVWQVALADGTHVYVGRHSGEIAAVRTRWWRVFDFMWGLHIMDLQTREDTHNPFVIAFGVLAVLGALLGTVLLFRRRKARVSAPQTSSG